MRSLLKSIISPLTRKILLVNLLAPFLLVIWFLFLDKYQVYLYQSEMHRLSSLSRILAADLNDNAISKRYTYLSARDKHKEEVAVIPFEVNKGIAGRILLRFLIFADFHIKLFNLDKSLVIDSDKLSKKKWKRPPRVNKFFSVSNPLIKGEYSPDIDSLKEIELLIKTQQPVASVYSRKNDSNIIIISTPIYSHGELAGILQIDSPALSLQMQIFDIQKAFLQIFLITLLITIILSVYLARFISLPLITLSKAANSIAQDKNRQIEIPIFFELKNEIGDLSLAIHMMTNTLWKLLDETEHFACDVAHELKNPLSSVLSAVDTISGIKDEEKKERLLSIIKEDVKRLNLLITDIASLSKIEGEMQRSKADIVNIYDILQGFVAAHGMKHQADKRVYIEFNLRGSKNIKQAEIYGDENRIAQVFENILSNAETFSPEEGTIRIELNIGRQKLKITIDDEGCGIPKGKEKQIFERFYSERPKEDKFGTHSGLGLAISKKIIESLGGVIYARNCLDKKSRIIGARFSIILNRKTS